MSDSSGFRDADHEAAFVAARSLVQRGGVNAVVCGARTRTGASCQQLPIREGTGRCLNHAGPHAARLHRERQRQMFMSGKISPAEWYRAEARRASNRLGWKWKKAPWTPGRTIDLGRDEPDFRSNLAARNIALDLLAPAVADWLRWRYRRTQIDRDDGRAWLRVVTQNLPERMAMAGPRPEEADMQEVPQTARTWTSDSNGSNHSSKRQNLDAPRAPKVVRGKGYGRRGRPRTQAATEDELGALMAIYRAQRMTIGPMFAACRSDGERMGLLRALRDYLAEPNKSGAHGRWMSFVGALRVS